MAATNYVVLKPFVDKREVYAEPGMIAVFDPAITLQLGQINSYLKNGVIMLQTDAATSTHPIAVAVTKLATAPA